LYLPDDHGSFVYGLNLSGHWMGWDFWCAPWMGQWPSWTSHRMNWEILWMKRKRWRKHTNTPMLEKLV